MRSACSGRCATAIRKPSGCCRTAHAAAAVRAHPAPRIASVAEVIANSAADARIDERPWLLAPCDLQAIKAAGVTFVASMLERVIEEQARGNPAQAEAVRKEVVALI